MNIWSRLIEGHAPLWNIASALLLVSITVLNHGSASAALITYDEQYFLSHYTDPTGSLTFETLKDGTTYTDVVVPHSLLTNQSWGNDPWGRYEAREYAWHDDYLIRTTNGFGGYWTAMRWDGSSVGNRHHPTAIVALSIVSLANITPISLEISSASYNGFVGIIPESPTDYHYLLNLPQLRVEEMTFGYQEAFVSSPSTLLLFATGALALIRHQRKRFSRRSTHFCLR
jgi:hypothetical protein